MPLPAFSRKVVWVASLNAAGESERRWVERLVIGGEEAMVGRGRVR